MSKISIHADMLLRILACELFHTDIPLGVNGVDWPQVYKMAEKHAITALVHRVTKNMPDVPDAIVASLRVKAVASAMRNEYILFVQDEVLTVLEKISIPCAILKGSSISVCYPHHETRTMGDIDLLVDQKNLDSVHTALLDAGYHYSSKHDFHACYEGKGVHIEIHDAVSRFPNTAKGNYTAAYMQDALRSVSCKAIGEYHYPVLDIPHQIISMLAHMERHMTAVGFGLRQLCDWAVVVHNYMDAIDDDILTILQNCGLLKFAKICTKACSLYLGMPSANWCGDIPDQVAFGLMQEVINASNTYMMDMDRGLSSLFAAGEENDHKHRTLFGRYMVNINRKARKEYPQITMCALTFPLFWIFYPMRWCMRTLKGKRKKVNVYGMLSIAHKRKELYHQLELFQ